MTSAPHAPPCGQGPPATPHTRQPRGPIVGALVVIAVAVVALVSAIVVVLDGREEPGGDPFAGSYPVVPPAPTPHPETSWQPTAPPAGPLPRFSGTPSKVIGRIVDREAGLSYAKLGPPWMQRQGMTHTAAQEIDTRKPKFAWYAGLYSEPLGENLRPALAGPGGIRAISELAANAWIRGLYDESAGDRRIPIAGQGFKADGHAAWLTAFRMHDADPLDKKITERTAVIMVVDTGRRVPGVIEFSVANTHTRLLPDVQTVIRSIRVLR